MGDASRERELLRPLKRPVRRERFSLPAIWGGCVVRAHGAHEHGAVSCRDAWRGGGGRGPPRRVVEARARRRVHLVSCRRAAEANRDGWLNGVVLHLAGPTPCRRRGLARFRSLHFGARSWSGSPGSGTRRPEGPPELGRVSRSRRVLPKRPSPRRRRSSSHRNRPSVRRPIPALVAWELHYARPPVRRGRGGAVRVSGRAGRSAERAAAAAARTTRRGASGWADVASNRGTRPGEPKIPGGAAPAGSQARRRPSPGRSTTRLLSGQRGRSRRSEPIRFAAVTRGPPRNGRKRPERPLASRTGLPFPSRRGVHGVRPPSDDAQPVIDVSSSAARAAFVTCACAGQSAGPAARRAVS
jgi:hypothetical protein